MFSEEVKIILKISKVFQYKQKLLLSNFILLKKHIRSERKGTRRTGFKSAFLRGTRPDALPFGKPILQFFTIMHQP